jgi:hypothetical protein
VTIETQARCHRALGRIIVALQYEGRANLIGALSPAKSPQVLSTALSVIANRLPAAGGASRLRSAMGSLSHAYFNVATDNEREAVQWCERAEESLSAYKPPVELRQ